MSANAVLGGAIALFLILVVACAFVVYALGQLIDTNPPPFSRWPDEEDKP